MTQECFESAITIDEAIEVLKTNTTQAYKWYIVKNNHNVYIELGGRNYHDEFEWSAHIPEFIENEYVLYSNNIVKSECSITSFNLISGLKGRNIKIPYSVDLLKFIKETDFRTYKFNIKEKIVDVKYTYEYSVEL